MAKRTPLEKTRDDAFKRARDHWDARMRGGDSAVKAWTVSLVLAILLSLISLFYAAEATAAPKYVGQVLTRNAQTGETTFQGMEVSAPEGLDDDKARYLLRQFILQVRSVSSDLYVIKQNIYFASFYTTDSGTAKLSALIKAYDPVGLYNEKKTVDVRFIEYVHLSEKTWHVRWYEETSIAGRPYTRVVKDGTFTWEKSTPANEEARIMNPFRHSISDFNITEVRSN